MKTFSEFTKSTILDEDIANFPALMTLRRVTVRQFPDGAVAEYKSVSGDLTLVIHQDQMRHVARR
jgi:hypothetical protein